MKFDFDIKPG